MRKLIMTGMAVAMLAVPTAAMADSPTADYWQFKDNTTYNQPNGVGHDNAQITHNGWSVGGNKHYTGPDGIWSGGDQTTSPGSRADNVSGVNNGK